MFKYFHQGKEIQKEDTCLSLRTISPYDFILATQGRGKPSFWYRFDPKEDVSNRCWCNSANYVDGIAFIAKRPCLFGGFVLYAAKNESQFEMVFEVKVNGDTKIKKGPKYTCTNWVDKYFYHHKVEELFELRPEDKVEIGVWIAKDVDSKSNVDTYSGSNGTQSD